MNPNAKFAMPAASAAVGRTSLGKWICLIRRSCDETEMIASAMELVNHFQGRIAAKMNSG